MKILHVLWNLNAGGTETWLVSVLRCMDRRKFQFDFCLLDGRRGDYIEEVESLGSRVFACPRGRNMASFAFHLPSFAFRFLSLLRRECYDAVHSHIDDSSGFVLRLAALKGVPRRISHSHTTRHSPLANSDGIPDSWPRHLYRRWMQHWIRAYATDLVAVSQDAAQALFGPRWTADRRCKVVHCGINLERFRRASDGEGLRRELGLPSDVPVVGHVGRFRPAKNHEFLVRVAEETLRRRPEVHFVLVGDGPLRAQIEGRIRELGMQENFVFAGVRRDVPQLMMGVMDAFLFPSRWEGLPLAPVEAQAAGLPCVVSDRVPGEAAVVEAALEYLPLTVPPSAWALSLLRVLERGRLDRQACLRAIEASSFSIDHSIQNLEGLYERVA